MAKDNVNKLINHIENELGSEFFVTLNEKFVWVFDYSQKRELVLVGNKKTDSYLHQLNAEISGEVLSDHDMKRLKSYLLSKCHTSGIKKDYYVRVFSKNNKADVSSSEIYIDRNAEDGSCVHISANGFKVIKNQGIPFLSLSKQLELPFPKKTDVKTFYESYTQLLNFKKSSDALISLAFMVKTIWRDFGANPFLIFLGEKGSGKSTATKITKLLIDPTMPELLSPPTNDENMNALTSNWFLLAFDNLSFLSNAMADTYCRMSTGAGNSKRGLYSDDDEISYNIKRPIIFNGIDELTSRTDFLDRSITISTKKIDDEKRISETELWKNFEELYPSLLGGLYQLIANVIKVYPTIKIKNLPRMGEFAIIGTAIARILGFPDQYFMEIYNENLNRQTEDAFWNDDLCLLLHDYLKEKSKRPEHYFYELSKIHNKPFDENLIPEYGFFKGDINTISPPFLIGTAGKIKTLLDEFNSKDQKNGRSKLRIPQSAGSLSKQINRIKHTLATQGIVLVNDRTSKERIKILGFKDHVERYQEIVSVKEGEYTDAVDLL